MTTFELLALLITILIMIVLLFFGVVWKLLDDIKEWQKSICDKLCSIRADMYDDVGNHYLVEILNKLDNIEDNILDESNGIPALVDTVDKMHRNLCVEIADKMVDRAYPPTYVTPCYAPNGICTNPQRDCVNCPKRSTGGSWSTNTSIKAEDAPLQEWFNDNKED